MPLQNSRSSLNSHFADARARSWAPAWKAVCSEIPLSRLRQPIFSEVASWVGICPAESGNRTRSAEGRVKSQTRAMWQSPGPAVKQWQHLGPVSHYEGGVLARDEGHKIRGRQGQVLQTVTKAKTGPSILRRVSEKNAVEKRTLVYLHCAHEHTQPHIEPDALAAGTSDTQKGTEKQRAHFKQLHSIATMSVKLSLFQ